MKNIKLGVIVIVIIIIAIPVYSSFFVINEWEYALVLRFSEVKQQITKPGLYFKAPFIDSVKRIDNRQREWDGEPNQIPTKDKKYISIDTTARWRVVDPYKYYTSVGNEIGAQTRLDDILDGAVRDGVTSYRLDEIVRDLEYYQNNPSDSKDTTVPVGREKIISNIEEIGRKEVSQFGIALTDLRFKRTAYVPEVRTKVYERMIAERDKVSAEYISEGKEEAAKINGEMDKELKEIRSESYKKSVEIRGQADAEATKIYAEAYSADPEFYKFLQTLESYEESVTENTKLVINADSDFYRYFKTIFPKK
jgi:membrane protease subunit HflC